MSVPVEEKVVEVDGLPVHYREAGRGKPLVFLHGAGGAPPAGASFVAMLAESCRVLIPSRPGFDETPIGSAETPEAAARIVAGFINGVAEEPVNVVAQSAGGAVGCWLAILEPARVASLVLSAPSAFAVRDRHGGARPAPEEMDVLLYGNTPCWSGPPTAPEQERIAENARANMPRTQSPDGNRDLRARLSEIGAPTLLLVGTGDRMIPEEAMRPYQKEIPDCRRVLIYGAAHELPISAGPRWVRLVGDFIERGEASVVNARNRARPQ